MIPEDIIEEIKRKSDIVQIISEYVPLKKKGKNYLGLCPFHNEKTPSFTVSQEKELWHCFGCGAGGNALSFVMKIDNLSFVEAVKAVGEKVGVAVREEQGAALKVKKEKNEILYALCQKASIFFQDQLRSDNGKNAREYLEKRGVPEELVRNFKLGYVPREWDSLLKHLTSAGYSPAAIEQAGLAVVREKGDGYYDRFRGRLMFEVTDSCNRPIAFGGRITGNIENEPKYLNSPETPVFSKGKMVYAFYQALPKIRETKTVILTEGYMDTITCHQFGFTNAVASLGTALTFDQARLLARYVETVIVAYDSDNAGQLATERALEVLRGANVNSKVAQLKGKDPDEMLRTEGSEAFSKALAAALPSMKYLLDRAFAQCDVNTPEGKNKAAQLAAQILNAISQDVLRQEYVRYVSDVLKIEEKVFLSVMHKEPQQRKTTASPVSILAVRPSTKHAKAAEVILKAALEDEVMRDLILNEIEPTDIESEIEQELFNKVQENKTAHTMEWVELLSENTQKFARRLLLLEMPWNEKIVQDCIHTLKSLREKKQFTQLRAELKKAEEQGNEGKARELLEAIKNKV